MEHPVSKALIRVLVNLKDRENDELLNLADDCSRDIMVKKIGKVKVLEELLDLPNLLDGEVDE